jgi:hypothetical protein
MNIATQKQELIDAIKVGPKMEHHHVAMYAFDTLLKQNDTKLLASI